MQRTGEPRTSPYAATNVTITTNGPGRSSFKPRRVTTLYQRLTMRDMTQPLRTSSVGGGAAPDGRRKFGSLRDAIVAVLQEADRELRVREVHAAVEQLLGEPVSRGSVKSYLRVGCRRKQPLFAYSGPRGYRLL